MEPIGADILLKYKCIQCDGINYIETFAAETDEFKIACQCGNVFDINKLSKVRVIWSQVQKSNKAQSPSRTTPSTDKALDTLVGLGVKRTAARQTIDQLGLDSMSAEEVVKEVLACQ